MHYYDELSSLVEHGEVNLINMIAVPRSMSTALGRALNEAEEQSLFINEPFNRHNRSLEVAAQRITEIALPELRAGSRSLTLIIKNMASYIGVDEFRGLLAVSRGNVWSIRHPLIQMGSLVTRIANDLQIENGANTITQNELTPYLEEVTRHLIDSPVSNNFSRTGWQNIGMYYFGQDSRDHSVVVEGNELTINPGRVLREASSILGLTFSDRMSSGWQHNYTNVNVGTSKLDTTHNGWTSQAATTTSITPTGRAALEISSLPAALQDHILKVAIPIYERMITDKDTP